ncbi:MAG TPA: glycosyltransferase family 4 protein [Luteibacter sp.]|uniref:glycosyltransferase family 4 protein n=1 Tax=Luteibacter sp. TaxID=1886636 RepID=UPI002C1F8975|nr:glycosyltransferase family 4 protein [Luteibacter sp.]HVI53979.1 glycosyltransferase family 4 protein [Luteibacter sp.]
MHQRVLFITRKWAPAVGGMETYSIKLTEALAARTVLEVKTLAGRADGTPPGMISLAMFLVKSVGLLMRRKVDVVHIGDLVLWPLALIARWAKSAPRVAMTAYGLDLIYGRRRGALPWIYRRYLKLGVRLTRRSARVIAISRATAALCREAGFSDVIVVTLGVDAPSPLPAAVEAPASRPFVLFVGRLVRRKGAAWFAREVLPLLPPPLRLVVVGKCWDVREMEALQGSERIEYRDFVSDDALHALRREATVIVMPNIPSDGLDAEGFGLTALEAAADGGVLLASGIEGIVDAVVDGETGFLLPAGDAVTWAAKIREIERWTSAERRAFIGRAQHVVSMKFSWAAVAEQTIDAYRMGE